MAAMMRTVAVRLLRRPAARVLPPKVLCTPSYRGLVTASSPKKKINRFYEKATAVQHGEVWRVMLDDKPVKSPRGTFLDLPTAQLAEAVAHEWDSQGENLKPMEMPLTTVGCTALDLVQPDKGECIKRMMPYLRMDTVCFEDENPILKDLQAKEWSPLRFWFEERFGVQLGVGRGLEKPPHPEATLSVVEQALQDRDAWELTAMEITTQTAKSLVVAVALVDREDVTAEQAFRWAQLEEHFQIEKWGLVEGEHDVAHAESLMWFGATRRFGKLGRLRGLD